ncbi:class I SAM-dependent methyltransferase [Amycolatopsis nigrescens]|uniref:class I SAM-dependent methyltransferase n=1 Tax=Amycolatopsis nigrescens TaxID=381445 RepID=UPI000381F96D|nr:class I SAM-dependent methyltransferase [Amycolatopsis nigrescens]
MGTETLLVEALSALRDGDRESAARQAGRAAGLGSRLGAELAEHLDSANGRQVYDQPAAFTTFVRGGGNVELYQRLSAELARCYETLRPDSLLDLGCGDGLAIAPALEQAGHAPGSVELVEPSAALLEQAQARLGAAVTRSSRRTAQEFLATSDQHWDLTQSTFALQSLTPSDRLDVLRALRGRTGTLLLAEFDIPELTEGSAEYLSSLVTRYERGIAEYGEDARLVAQGFLLPMLLGQTAPDGGRNNWEQPVPAWRAQLAEAGYTEVTVHRFADYWWSPAVLISASF